MVDFIEKIFDLVSKPDEEKNSSFSDYQISTNGTNLKLELNKDCEFFCSECIFEDNMLYETFVYLSNLAEKVDIYFTFEEGKEFQMYESDNIWTTNPYCQSIYFVKQGIKPYHSTIPIVSFEEFKKQYIELLNSTLSQTKV